MRAALQKTMEVETMSLNTSAVSNGRNAFITVKLFDNKCMSGHHFPCFVSELCFLSLHEGYY